MAISVGEIKAIATLHDTISPKLSTIQKNSLKTAAAISKSGSLLQSWGRAATLATAAVGAGAVLAGKSFAQFEYRMNRVGAVTQSTGALFDSLTNQAKHLGSTTVFSANQAAEGMGFLGQAGFEAHEILAAMPGVLDLAAAGQMGLAETADIASNILKGFNLNAGEMGRVGDVMAKTFISSNVNVTMLGETMKYVAPLAATAGQSLETMSAMAGKLGDAGIQASLSGTALRAIISRLLKPTGAAAAVLKDLGVVTRDSSGQMRDMEQIMIELGEAGITSAQMIDLFGRRAVSAGAVLVKSAKEVSDFSDELEKAGGTAKEVAERQMSGLMGAFIEFTSAIDGMRIAIGKQLAPVFESLLVAFTGIARFVTHQLVPAWEDLAKPIKATVIAIGLMAASIGPLLLVGGTLLTMIGGMVAALQFLVPAFVAVKTVGIMGALIPGLTHLLPVLAAVKISSIAMWGAITGGVAIVVAAIWIFRDQVTDALGGVVKFFAAVIDGFLIEADRMFGWVPGVSEKLEGARAAVANWGNDTSQALFEFGEKTEVAKEGAERLGFGVVEALEPARTEAEGLASGMDEVADRMEHARSVVAEGSEYWGRFAVALEWNKTIARDTHDNFALLADESLARTATALLEVKEQAIEVPNVLMRIKDAMYRVFKEGDWKGAVGDAFAAIVTGAQDAGRRASQLFTSALSAGLAAIPIAGPFLKSFAEPIVNGVKSLAGKVGGFFKGIFGGGKSEADKMIEAAQKAAEEAARIAREAAEAARDAARKAAEEYQQFMEGVTQDAMSMWEKVKAGAMDAYQTAYNHARDMGLGVQEATAIAEGAHLKYIREVLAAEGEKHARLAAFEAALYEIKRGNLAGAAEAARLAYEQTTTAWQIATEHMIAADNIMTEEFEGGSEGRAAAAEASYQEITQAAESSSTASVVAANNVTSAMGGVTSSISSAASAADGLTSSLHAIPSHIESTISVVKTTFERTLVEAPVSISSTGGSTTHTIVGASRGTGGIRDFGPGTPAVLHGREAVMTQAQIEKLIGIAAQGGRGGGGGGDMVIELDGEKVGRSMMKRMGRIARTRVY